MLPEQTNVPALNGPNIKSYLTYPLLPDFAPNIKCLKTDSLNRFMIFFNLVYKCLKSCKNFQLEKVCLKFWETATFNSLNYISKSLITDKMRF